jgi:uncharacterized protein YeaO (DUF488 family)
MAESGDIRVKRVYLAPEDDDGQRILVDRLWPRGLTKEKAGVDLWLKDVAPSTDLRQSFHHGEIDWSEFRRRYEAELVRNPALVELRRLVAAGPVTLLYSVHDEAQNHALILADHLRPRAG